MKKVVFYVVATWIWWTTLLMVGAAAWNNDDDFTPVPFSTIDATADSYNKFIAHLRDNLSSTERAHGRPVTRDPSTVGARNRFLLVELTNRERRSVTIAIDVINAYVVAYRADSRSYFLRPDTPDDATGNLFRGTERVNLTFTGSYHALETVAQTERDALDLGMDALDRAISNLHRYESGNYRDMARGFLVCIQMISEAARFSYIQRFVARYGIGAGDGFRPDYAALSFQTNWARLSTAIQNSQDGVFPGGPIGIQRPSGSTLQVDRVSAALLGNIGLMLFACRQVPRLVLPGVIRSVVDREENKMCKTWEPTVRISGRDGLCVDVKDGHYNNGDPIILWPCKSNTDANQLWTLKKDGTIQSNGKCLTAYSLAPGKYVMIYACDQAVPLATSWELLDDGSIINPAAKLALGAQTGNSGTTLTLDTINFGSSQGWTASNITEPFATAIVGFTDLCLQAEGDNTAWLGECDKNKYEQLWVIYPDGSIRPDQKRDKCLACKDDGEASLVLIESCTGTSKERWLFKNDNTIANLRNKFVIDVKGGDLSLKQLIIYRPTGNTNQKWFMAL